MIGHSDTASFPVTLRDMMLRDMMLRDMMLRDMMLRDMNLRGRGANTYMPHG